MKNLLPKLLLIFFFFLSSIKINAQSDLSHEVGIMFGVTSFQTDFGLSDDFDSANASTLGFGLVYYLNFFGKQYNWRSGTSYFSEHFKLRADLLYTNKTNIKHEPWINQGDGSLRDQQMDAMRGNIRLIDVGARLEYYFFTLENYSTMFGQKNTINPYVSAGLHFAYYDPKVTSALNPFNSGGDPVEIGTVEGDVEPYAYIPNWREDKWQTNAIFNDSGTSFGVSLGGGVRYSMQYFDMVLDARWQHFFSDRIDGLDAPNDPGNKNNDTMIFVNLGVVYTFNFY